MRFRSVHAKSVSTFPQEYQPDVVYSSRTRALRHCRNVYVGTAWELSVDSGRAFGRVRRSCSRLASTRKEARSPWRPTPRGYGLAASAVCWTIWQTVLHVASVAPGAQTRCGATSRFPGACSCQRSRQILAHQVRRQPARPEGIGHRVQRQGHGQRR